MRTFLEIVPSITSFHEQVRDGIDLPIDGVNIPDIRSSTRKLLDFSEAVLTTLNLMDA